jgi:hypothetical protein
MPALPDPIIRAAELSLCTFLALDEEGSTATIWKSNWEFWFSEGQKFSAL